MKRIGIIGGSGLYEMEGFEALDEHRVETPFGDPSDAIVCGALDGLPVAFVPRHGRGHRFNPSEINYRANIWALKSLGVDFVLSVSATGSMREEIRPGHFVFPTQFIDRTRGKRADTFFQDGIVGHVGFADPTSLPMIDILTEAAQKADIPHHPGGAYVCIEGPQFSTRAESRLYRSWDEVKVIGMTNLTEAKLAREAELHYATIAMATDYDVWHESEEDVSVDQVLATMAANVGNAKLLIRRAAPRVAALRGTKAAELDVLRFAVMTAPEYLTPEVRDRVRLLMKKYWEE